MLLPVSEYDSPRRVNLAISGNFLVNNCNGPERLTVPPTVRCVKSVSALTEDSPKRLASKIRDALLKSKPCPMNWYFEAKSWNPRLIGLPSRYGSVKPNCTLCERLPPESARLRDSPYPSRLLVEYSSPKKLPAKPETPPLSWICWRPF